VITGSGPIALYMDAENALASGSAASETLHFRCSCMPALLLHALQSLLKPAEHIFCSLRGRALHDHAPHKLFLLCDLLFCFLDIMIGGIR
jgi:hypothetical protein